MSRRPCVAVPAKHPQLNTALESIPEDHDLTGHRRRGQAVILQALEDKATHWFLPSYSRQSFDFWCSVAGLDAGQVRKKDRKVVVMSSVS